VGSFSSLPIYDLCFDGKLPNYDRKVNVKRKPSLAMNANATKMAVCPFTLVLSPAYAKASAGRRRGRGDLCEREV